MSEALRGAARAAAGVGRDASAAAGMLFKIMIPIIIGVKILQELGWIPYLARPLAPVMELVGLPGSMGLVWATALVNNLYAAMVVYFSLAAEDPLSCAQITVLATMMLMAHALPLEGKIAQKAGTRLSFQLLVRAGGAFVLGWMLHLLYSSTGWLQEPSRLFWEPGQDNAGGLGMWVWEQIQNLAMIFGIILVLVALMRLLQYLGVTQLLVRLLQPLLRLLGISGEAAPIAIVGMTMGLAYGGGLILHETKSGRVARQDIFFSLTLMGLAHSLIEDTLLMTLLGAHVSGLLWGRLLFSLLLVFALVRVVRVLPPAVVDRFLFKR
ncbi:MAG: nucleoside recognition domain-containing protein [Thermodesulfobacteriota bacterium]